ncbi:hypothetical protein ACT7DN_00350 [Bacillus paranthracis]
MGSTTDGGGGSKSGSELGQGIVSQDGYIRGSALQVVASAHGAFGTINGNPAGAQGGQGLGKRNCFPKWLYKRKCTRISS